MYGDDDAFYEVIIPIFFWISHHNQMDLCDDVIREIVSFLRIDTDVIALALCSHQFYEAIFKYDDNTHLRHVVCFGQSPEFYWEPVNAPELRKQADSIPDWYYDKPIKKHHRPSVFVAIDFKGDIEPIPGDIFILCDMPAQDYDSIYLVECDMDITSEDPAELQKCAIYNRTDITSIVSESPDDVDYKECKCAGYIGTDEYVRVQTIDGHNVYMANGWAIVMNKNCFDVWGRKGTISVGDGDVGFMTKISSREREKIHITIEFPYDLNVKLYIFTSMSGKYIDFGIIHGDRHYN